MSNKEPGKLAIFRYVYLSEGDRLVEMMCGLIMVLVMIGYLRLSLMGGEDIEMKNTLILVPLGCNAAWGIIDGIMYVLTNLIGRGKIYKLSSSIQCTKDQTDARISIEDDLSSTIVGSLKKEDKEKIYDEILKRVDHTTIQKPEWVTKEDLLVVLFTFLIVFSISLPLIIPFMIFDDLILAIHISHIIGLVMLFFIGYLWGKYASRNKIRSAIAMMIIGGVIVGITMVLGG
ncbi:MAG TPA: VIT1/CCC1 transporter family protein [Nitrosarchaeum sp.]|nr:VIT1/CCC1 transporter family protein [Nitrosarchaeum sp.]